MDEFFFCEEGSDKILGTLNLTVNPHLKVFIIPSYMESSRHWSTLQNRTIYLCSCPFRHNDVQSLLLYITTSKWMDGSSSCFPH
jgi:hypothetical protein